MSKTIALCSRTSENDSPFVVQMKELFSKRPSDFEWTVRMALRDVLDESSSEVLATLLGEEGLQDPEAFARQTMRFLGTGSHSLCLVVMKYAMGLSTKGGRLEN